MAVLASDELKLWLGLQGATLDRVHHSWFADADAGLIDEARKNAFGRRWLSTQLARRRPVLFSPIQWSDVDRLRAATWLFRPLENPTESALELGALALAGALRTIVVRADVMKLRVALGAARYERVLGSQAHVGPVERLVGDGDIVERVVRRGAVELAGYASAAHPAWGESVRFSFDRQWWDAALSSSLTPAMVETSLRRPDDPIEVVLTGTTP